jgi:hypothetical protein
MQRAATGRGATSSARRPSQRLRNERHIIREEPTWWPCAKLQPGDGRRTTPGYHMLTRDLQGPVVSRDMLSFIRDPGRACRRGAAHPADAGKGLSLFRGCPA